VAEADQVCHGVDDQLSVVDQDAERWERCSEETIAAPGGRLQGVADSVEIAASVRPSPAKMTPSAVLVDVLMAAHAGWRSELHDYQVAACVGGVLDPDDGGEVGSVESRR
jgi:hypothetical protein